MTWSAKRIAVTDTETTGLSDNDVVFELGVVHLENGRIDTAHHQLFNPLRTLPPFVINLTGYTDCDVRDKPVWNSEQFLRWVLAVDGGARSAYNAEFDCQMLRQSARPGLKQGALLDAQHWLDPLVLAKAVTRASKYTKGYKLEQVADRLKLQRTGAGHTAVSDAALAARVLWELRNWLPQAECDVLRIQSEWSALQTAVFADPGCRRDRYDDDGGAVTYCLAFAGEVLVEGAASGPLAARRMAQQFLRKTPGLAFGWHVLEFEGSTRHVDNLLRFQQPDGVVNAI